MVHSGPEETMSDTDAEAAARTFLAVLRERRDSLDQTISVVLREFPHLEPKDATAKAPKASGATTPASDGPGVFEQKYEKTSSQYFLEALREADRPMALPEIDRALRAQGIEFHRETLTYAGKQLEKKGRIRKREAPPESAYKWLYELRKDGEE